MSIDASGLFGTLPSANEFLHDVFETPSGCTFFAWIARNNALSEARSSGVRGALNGPQDAFEALHLDLQDDAHWGEGLR
jgi:hypothetical protein